MANSATIAGLLEEIRRNTSSSPKPSGPEFVEAGLIEEASKVPLSILISFPTVLSGVLPLVFKFGSDIGTIHVAAMVSTFFLVFFTLPIMLLVFRAYGLGYTWFFLYALLFAAAGYGVNVAAADWPQVTAVLVPVFAIVFGSGPQLLVSRWPKSIARRARWLRSLRRKAQAEVAEKQSPAKRAPSWFSLPPGWHLNRRARVRVPSPSMIGLTSVLTGGIMLLHNAPRTRVEMGLIPVRRDSGAAGINRDTIYAQTVALLPILKEAKSRSNTLAKLRQRDTDAVELFQDSISLWNNALVSRTLLVQHNRTLLDSASALNIGTIGLVVRQWNGDTTWAHHIRLIDQHHAALLTSGRGGPRRDPVADNLAAMLDTARMTLRSEIARSLRTGDSVDVSRVQNLELYRGMLQAPRNERTADLLSLDDRLSSQQSQLLGRLNNFAQREMARVVNNARIVGLWMFGLALLVVAVAWATAEIASKRPATRSQSGMATQRAIWFRRNQARRKGTYVLGCALLSILSFPLLQKIEAEEMDLSQPFTPFTLPLWYLPAFAEQTVQAPIRNATSETRIYRQQLTNAPVPPTGPEPRDTIVVNASVPFDSIRNAITTAMTAAVGSSTDTVVQRVGGRIDNASVRVLTRLDSTRTELADSVGRTRREIQSVGEQIYKVPSS